MKTLQLIMDVTTNEETKNSWAFAVDKRRIRSKRLRSTSRCFITACSKEARNFGIQTGMRYEEAKLLLPDLRVFICNWN